MHSSKNAIIPKTENCQKNTLIKAFNRLGFRRGLSLFTEFHFSASRNWSFHAWAKVLPRFSDRLALGSLYKSDNSRSRFEPRRNKSHSQLFMKYYTISTYCSFDKSLFLQNKVGKLITRKKLWKISLHFPKVREEDRQDSWWILYVNKLF